MNRGIWFPVSALLGAVLGGESWAAWRAVLIAAMGELLQPDELDLFRAVGSDRSQFSRQVRDVMSTNLETLPPSADPSALVALFERDLVPMIVHEGRLLGLITKIDYLNYQRRRNHG